ncbi:MAG: 4Fe-4S binding protein [Bacillota bacterium]
MQLIGKRRLVQLFSALLTNSYLPSFFQRDIYQGQLKRLCVPFLNCYSCPGAVAACPVGSLQSLLVSTGGRLSFYVLGLLTLAGAAAGRFICGWLCPFGLLQEALAGLSLKKYRIPGFLTRTKYLILILTLLLPALWLNENGLGSSYFCQYLCPAGTLEAGLLLGLGRPELRALLGPLFTWKVAVLGAFLAAMIFTYRPFCRTACPLGAFYGLFNPVSLWRVEVAAVRCNDCRACRKSCPLDIPVYRRPNSPECIRCLACLQACPQGALTFSAGGCAGVQAQPGAGRAKAK